ncbi:diguanylate cyclase [Niveispirillum sp. KHB5.9]|uniref:diguanylate cyclase n=1 Tax=Niveispirillum sp. KHB5.9 TaxID=3400269 RepID=UPI003A8456C0
MVDDDFLFAEDGTLKGAPAVSTESRQPDGPPWRILIVDDDEEVHSVTRYALRKVRFRDRPLELLSAYSASQALTMLATEASVALVLLDVVMETDDAGLRLVRAIRQNLGDTAVRIILRTGQPGQAPEERVIVDYDVNDYKAKTELTSQKLFTTVIAALRAYDSITTIEANRRGLRRMIALDDRLRPDMGLEAYAQTVLEQVGPILGANASGLACVVEGVEGWSIGGTRFRPLAATGGFAGTGTVPATSALHVRLTAALVAKRTGVDGRTAILYMPGPDGGAFLALLDFDRPLLPADAEMLGVLTAKFAGGLVNLVLYEQLSQANTDLRALAQTLEHRVAERTRELSEANAKLETLASIDSLTGILNRRRFMELAEAEWDRSTRYGRPFSLLLLDLDQFKRINDGYGHAAGDTAIRVAAERAASALRTTDSLARFGGEELVVLLPESELAAATLVAERIRASIGSHPVLHEDKAIPLTTSIGVATWRGEGESLAELLDRADQALYQAKQLGRNRVEASRITVS